MSLDYDFSGLRMYYDEMLRGSLIFYALLNVINLIYIIFGLGGYSQLFILLNLLFLIAFLTQDRSKYKTKESNNQVLFVGFLSYLTYVLSMFAMQNNVFVIEVLIFTAIYGMWAISLNLSTGIVGILNFGVIAQVAVGAVITGIMAVNGWPIFLAVFFGMIGAGIFSVILAFTTVRLRDDYFAIVSITVGEIFRQLLNTERTLRASPSTPEGEYPATPGILSIPQPFFDLIEGSGLEEYGYRLFLGLFSLMLLVIVYFVVERIFNSPYGRVLRSIREDATVVESYGKDVLRFKLEVMFLSGMVAGLGGAIYGWAQYSLFPNNFTPIFTFYVWVAFIIGGRGNNKGMIFGAMIFVILERSSRFLDDPSNPIIRSAQSIADFFNPQAPEVSLGFIQLMLVGVFLIVFLRFLPKGVIPEEPYEPDIGGYRLPERGSQSEDQMSLVGGDKE